MTTEKATHQAAHAQSPGLGLPRRRSSVSLQLRPRPRPQAWSPPPQARSAPEPRTPISGFPPPPLPPPPRSLSPVRSGVIPDQDGGRGASRLVRFISARASLGLRQRAPSQRAGVGQRRPRGGRRRGRTEPLVTTAPLSGSPRVISSPGRTPSGSQSPAGAGSRAGPPGSWGRRFPSSAGPGLSLRLAPCSLLGPASSARSPHARAPSSRPGRTCCCWVSVLCRDRGCRLTPPLAHSLCADSGAQPRPASRPAADSWGTRHPGSSRLGPSRPFSSPGCGVALSSPLGEAE